MSTPQVNCAGWLPGTTACQKVGRFTCKNCFLVVYCGPACQRSHWTSHKSDCKSDLGKDTWQPNWALKNRRPAFAQDEDREPLGGDKFLWGDIPAYDVFQLDSNEGSKYKGRLNALFAASGDLRNVVKTIAQLPTSYQQPIDVTLNDLELDVVARNVIILLIALVVENKREAVDCIVHIWYSALIRKSHLDILQQRIRPLVEEVCHKIRAKRSKKLLEYTWKFGRHSLSLVLAKPVWSRLLSYMDVPPGLDADTADRIRRSVTLAKSRLDYRERNLLFHTPAHRIAKNRFWEDGILLPFGSRRDEFVEPNPTFFHTPDIWPLRENADPLNGWLLKDVDATPSGPATADIYGKLFYHVRSVLESFLRRLSGLTASFKLLHVDAHQLSDHIEAAVSFDRIEVANISDNCYLGLHRTVAYLAPLLQKRAVNPHATLITMFIDAIDEAMLSQDHLSHVADGSEANKRLVQYVTPIGRTNGAYDPVLIRFDDGRVLTTSHDRYFERFVKWYQFEYLGSLFGVVVKNENTIIEKWPFKLKLEPGQAGAQEEFDRAICAYTSSKERYVEWKRV